MRVAVFTGNPHLAVTPWWRLLLAMPGLERVLVCRLVTASGPRDVVRRFWRNVRRHGPFFVPYRIGLLTWSLLSRPLRRADAPAGAPAPPPGVAVEEIEALNLHAPDVLERVRAFGADLGVSLGAPVLRASLFRLPRRGTINLHLGRVPDFRGAPPAFWELVTGAPVIGATIHWMDEGLDTGAIIASGEAPIHRDDSLIEVEARAAELGARLLREALQALARGEAPARPQPPGGSTHRFPTLGQRMALGRRLTFRRLRRGLAPRALAKRAAMAAALYLYRPLRDLARTVRRRHPVRVFTFHRVTTLCRDGMTVSPALFREQVAYVAHRHVVVSLERGLELIRQGARLGRPHCVITFDDGYRSVCEEARPVLAAAGVPGCCFVSTDLVGTDRRFAHDDGSPVRPWLEVMDWSDIGRLRDAGWSVGNHTAGHARLSACTGDVLRREVGEPRRALRERLGIDATVLAYPFGQAADISDEALRVAAEQGHTTVFHNRGGENATGTGALLLARIDLGGDHARLAWKNLSHGIHLGHWRSLWLA